MNAPDSANQQTVAEPDPRREAAAGRTVLICEDEGLTQMQLRRIFERAGYRVLGSATNGEEAVAMACSHRPDLILMDINMPLLNGIDATRRIMSAYRPTVVMLTAYDSEATRVEAAAAGAAGYLTKPVWGADLLKQLGFVSVHSPSASPPA